MKVFVVGGTGAIGGHAVPALVRAARTVTALARTPEKVAQLSKQGASSITVSIFDRAALTEAFKGHDAVINIASAIPPTSKFMQTKAWAGQLRRDERWRGYGTYSLVAGSAALVLILLVFVLSNPASPLEIGGLVVRILVIEVFAWHAMVGWRLFIHA